MGEKDGFRSAKKFDEVGEDVVDGGLSPDHTVGDTMHLLGVSANELHGFGRVILQKFGGAVHRAGGAPPGTLSLCL